MAYDPASYQPLTPADHEGPRRAERLRELGLGQDPDPEFDEFARRLARITGAPYAMVNFITGEQQYFAGLYTPSSEDARQDESAAVDEPGRDMPRDHGWCPHVVVRRKALVLDDVCDYPRYNGNPVIDKLGIRSYLGAPLIDHTGTTLGTICVVDTDTREWGHEGLATIKEMAAEVVELINQRDGHGN
jgi:GAF domain-containing protein